MLKFTHFLTVGAGTAVSRVLGFIRDVAIAAALGAGPVADAFVVAFRLPNLFRRVFTEGAFNSAFVPAYQRKRAESGEGEAEDFAGDVMSVAMVAAIILATILIMASGWLVGLLAPGFQAEPQKFTLAAHLTQIALPYLPLTIGFAVMAAVLNAHNRFGAMAFAPNIMNVVMIAAILPFTRWAEQGSALAGWVLAGAVTLGGLLQLIIVMIALRRAGLRVKFGRPRWNRDLALLFRRAFSGVLASSIVQINMLTATVMASMTASTVSWLYYADRVYQLPLGIVSVAIGVVLLPAIADKTREGEHEAVNSALGSALEFGWMLTVPAAVGLYIIAQPICDVLFQRGAFTTRDSAHTAEILAILALSLPFLVSIKVLNAAFFAREDTTTPMRVALVGITLNALLCWLLFKPFGPLGIAWANMIAAVAAALLLWLMLMLNAHFSITRQSLLRIAGIIICGLGMGLALMSLMPLLTSWIYGPATLKAIAMMLLVIAGMIVYLALIFATGVGRLAQLKAALQRKDATPT